jgi:hypothetical protein
LVEQSEQRQVVSKVVLMAATQVYYWAWRWDMRWVRKMDEEKAQRWGAPVDVKMELWRAGRLELE